jgi:hypothetical protein
MIVVLTAPGHGYTLKSMVDGTFGAAVPQIRIASYTDYLKSGSVPVSRATHVFTDIERLSPKLLRAAADLYRRLGDLGVRCLNDPARVLSRAELLTVLHDRGLNPIRVYRADTLPRPERFPVFIRTEDDHETPEPTLYESQESLDEALARFRVSGMPLRGLLVIEKVDAPYSDTLWAKWGTWRIGERMVVEHIAVDDQWLVKHGRHECITEAVTADELDAITTNRFEPMLRPLFEIAGIEFGRADHAVTPAGLVVFEINTNPFLGAYAEDSWPLRKQAQKIARERLADALRAIDMR